MSAQPSCPNRRSWPALAALTAALALASAVQAEDARGAPMSAAEFDAYVTGKTLTYSQYGTVYGTEEYLPGRKVRWQVGDDCQYGHWYERTGLICFTYEYDIGEYCWTFWRDDHGLSALATTDPPEAELSEVQQTTDGLTCPPLDVGV